MQQRTTGGASSDWMAFLANHPTTSLSAQLGCTLESTSVLSYEDSSRRRLLCPYYSPIWWCTPVILKLRRFWKMEFRIHLNYILSSNLAITRENICNNTCWKNPHKGPNMHNSKRKICVKRTFPELKSLPFKNYENMLTKPQKHTLHSWHCRIFVRKWATHT